MHALGIPAVLLFGMPAEKDAEGSGAWDDEGVVQLATRAIKDAHPDLLVITDVCLCEYTDHGHCGVLRADGAVDNDATLELLGPHRGLAGARRRRPRRAERHDGRPRRRASAPRSTTRASPTRRSSPTAAKFASAFYGPFREAADSTPAFGDRRGYQMDPANADEARARGAARRRGGRRHGDGQARAALPRRDPRGSRTRRALPVAAYNVSGEYAMVKAAAAAGLRSTSAPPCSRR